MNNGAVIPVIQDWDSLQSERHCLNINFDDSVTRGGWGAVWYGSSLYSNSGVEAYYPSDINFIKCAVCCN